VKRENRGGLAIVALCRGGGKGGLGVGGAWSGGSCGHLDSGGRGRQPTTWNRGREGQRGDGGVVGVWAGSGEWG
jgi:hypothetical protein